MNRMAIAMTLLGCALLAGCAVGPRYQRPLAPTPGAWKTQGPWQPAAPKDGLPKGAWWKIFHDDQLDRLEEQLLNANQSLLSAADRLDQARSLARTASAGFFPQVNGDPLAQSQRMSANRPLNGAPPPGAVVDQTLFSLPFSLNYELDLFARVRRDLNSANAALQASAADWQNTQLTLTAELAAEYFALREIDAEAQVVRESVGYQQKGLELVQNRHRGGIASGLEVAQQQTVLDSTNAQLALLEQQRARHEHAIAVLTGNPASTFTLPRSPLAAAPPAIPPGIPSDLLERRPDIASAERKMAAANARVGLASAAFYPRISLSGPLGFQSRDLGVLATAPSAFWALGTDLFQPLLNGGRNRANLAATKAAYNESVANYRQSVLIAMQQVEDGLSGLDALAKAAATQQAAVEDARRALTLANHRYVGGLSSYLDVITAQTTLLANERLAVQLLGQQMVTSVYLIKALGGGWSASLIQNEQVHPQPIQAIQP